MAAHCRAGRALFTTPAGKAPADNGGAAPRPIDPIYNGRPGGSPYLPDRVRCRSVKSRDSFRLVPRFSANSGLCAAARPRSPGSTGNYCGLRGARHHCVLCAALSTRSEPGVIYSSAPEGRGMLLQIAAMWLMRGFCWLNLIFFGGVC